MTQRIKTRFVGLDVHKDTIVVAVAELGREAARVVATVPHEWKALRKVLDKLGPRSEVACCYEAGPTGFGLARALEARGIACVVAAPGKIERPAQDRVKTDRRDAERLVRLLMIGGLHPVRVPSNEEEALRDLVRGREDIRGDLMRSRHRLSKLLLRHDVRYEDTASAWTAAHRACWRQSPRRSLAT